MGKWTTSYYDDILAGKIKGLVAGAIKRTKLEKTEPTITYESFVEELDGGDSFTTSLIDILVKELAERRTRPTSADRRLIADSSAKSLRMHATPLRVYRERPGGRTLARRSNTMSDYLTAPPGEMGLDEDEDEFESMLGDAASTTEGARASSENYAHSGNSQRWARPPNVMRRSHPSYSAAAAPGSDDSIHDFLSRSHSPPVPSRSGPWTLPTSATISGSSLFRQPSIRRPVRSRTVDFNEFTSHRRSTIRQGAAQDPPPRSEVVDNRSTAGIISPRERSRSPTQDEPSSSVRAPQLARRFFPFSRNRRHETAWSTADTRSVESPDELSSFMVVEPREFEPWFSLPTPIPSSSSSSQPDALETEINDQHVQPAVRQYVPPVPDDGHVQDAAAYPSPSQHESNTDS